MKFGDDNKLKGLGKHQRVALNILATGGVLRTFRDYFNQETHSWIVDKDDCDVDEIDNKSVERLIKRGLVSEHRIYSTVQPDTDTYEFKLKSEFIEDAKKLFL